jgi:hypothetical protein
MWSRTMWLICTVLVLGSQMAAWGNDEIVSSGLLLGYLAPDPPYDPGNLTLQLTLGYGDASNTIGTGLWHRGPGIYDLAADPGLDGFLTHATNGLDDTLTVTVTDVDGYQNIYAQFSWEATLFGRGPGSSVDLAPLQINNVLLDVYDVQPAGGLGGGYDVIYARWLFLGTPEPSALTFSGGAWLILLLQRKRSGSR